MCKRHKGIPPEIKSLVLGCAVTHYEQGLLNGTECWFDIAAELSIMEKALMYTRDALFKKIEKVIPDWKIWKDVNYDIEYGITISSLEFKGPNGERFYIPYEH